MSSFDVVGVGLNATDTLILLPRFPAYGGKAPFEREVLSPGGQVASAMVTCAKLGMRAKYIGTLGDDERGRVQLESLRASGINLDDIEIRPNCPNQSAYILVDHSTGERTVLWHRDECLRIDPASLTDEKIACARLLHIDGHDTPAVARAAEIARRHQIPVTVDVDTIYPGFDRVLPNVDYLIASSEFPERWTHEPDPFRALAMIQNEYGMRVAAMTLGADGALARVDGQYIYSPGFRGGLHRYYRRRRRVSWSVLLCCDREHAGARSARIFKCHGGPELHGARRTRAHCRCSGGARFRPQRRPAFQPPNRAAVVNDPPSIL